MGSSGAMHQTIAASLPADIPQRTAPVWLPWVVAPAFLLLPIGGCGAAASLRLPRQVAACEIPQRQPAAPPLVPVAAIMTPLPSPR